MDGMPVPATTLSARGSVTTAITAFSIRNWNKDKTVNFGIRGLLQRHDQAFPPARGPAACHRDPSAGGRCSTGQRRLRPHLPRPHRPTRSAVAITRGDEVVRAAGYGHGQHQSLEGYRAKDVERVLDATTRSNARWTRSGPRSKTRPGPGEDEDEATSV
jgi:hypothetical protein